MCEDPIKYMRAILNYQTKIIDTYIPSTDPVIYKNKIIKKYTLALKDPHITNCTNLQVFSVYNTYKFVDNLKCVFKIDSSVNFIFF